MPNFQSLVGSIVDADVDAVAVLSGLLLHLVIRAMTTNAQRILFMGILYREVSKN
jgi:hypothetical protein